MTTTQIGEKTEAFVLAHMIKADWTVCLPFGNAKRYDFVIDCGDGVLLKAQCKTGRLRKGTIVFNACSVYNYTARRRHYRGEVDVFVVYCPENEKFYKIPVTACGKAEGCLRVDPVSKYVSEKAVKWAKSFEF